MRHIYCYFKAFSSHPDSLLNRKKTNTNREKTNEF